jgi:hypothetical protein
MNQAQVRFGRLNRKTAAPPAMHLIHTRFRPRIANLPAPGRLAPTRFALSWRDVADDHAQSKRLRPLERPNRKRRCRSALLRKASVSTRCPTSRISDWTPQAQRTIANLNSCETVGRVHFMVIQIAACGCSAARLAPFFRDCSYRLQW